jgi:pimeloyl-ACP methyl ester carboxylesterase
MRVPLQHFPPWIASKCKKRYRDDRIKAAFLMAPAWSWIFRADDVKNIHIPVYVVSGDQDEVIAPETNGLWFAKHISKAQFQWIKGAGHFIFLDSFSCEAELYWTPMAHYHSFTKM